MSNLPSSQNTKERIRQEEAGAGTTTPGGGSGDGASGRADAAPTYVEPVLGNLSASKPHGKNISEGGFDSDEHQNASFNSDIGTKNDPGRQSELEFEARGTERPEEGGRPIKPTAQPGGGESGRIGGQPYNPLSANKEA